MAVLVSCTFSIVTHESAEDGEAAESGFEWESVAYTFRELVRLMRDYPNASRWPACGDVGEWYACEPEPDYRTGDEETRAIHYSRDNAPRSAKYWRKAAIVAGIVKGGQ